MKFREAFDHKAWASMPIQHLHAETHGTLTDLGYDLAPGDQDSIKKIYRKDWNKSSYNLDLEEPLAKHGWYKLGEQGFSNRPIFNHPNGSVLLDKGQHIEMYGNFNRGDR